MVSGSRSRSRSPLPQSEGDAPPADADTEERRPLDRHEGAQRDNRPAWMTKGLGVNEEIFGETTGDLVKPGMTRADLEAIEAKIGQRSDSPDPFADFFDSRNDKAEQEEWNNEWRQKHPVAPSPWEASAAAPSRRRSRSPRPTSRAPPPEEEVEAAREKLVALAKETMQDGGFMQGGRLSSVLMKQFPQEVATCKRAWGGPRGWLNTLLDPAGIKNRYVQEWGGPCFWDTLDDEPPSEPSVTQYDKVPEKGSTQRAKEAKQKKGEGKGAWDGAVVEKLKTLNWKELTDAAVETLNDTAALDIHLGEKEMTEFLSELSPELVEEVKKIGGRDWLTKVMSLDSRIKRVAGDCEACRDRIGKEACYQLVKSD